MARRGGSGYPVGRLGEARDRHHRRTYISFSNVYGYPYGYGWPIVPGYPGLFDYDDYGDETGNGQGPVYYDYGDNGGYDNGGYGDLEQPQPQWPALGPNAGGTAWPQGASQYAAPAREQAVAILFRDGRPPLEIHNYVLTQTSLFVGDASGVTIPLDEIDLPATVKANQDAGVDFRLPKALN